ncbi:MAG TPA: class I SAM-dependent methyltransferase [Geminicoccaceae bacterium]|nr:class I SAM-dependent methyltransferase [Geminicoccaceae bacterium]
MLKGLKRRLTVRALRAFPSSIGFAGAYVARQFDRDPELAGRAYALFNRRNGRATGGASAPVQALIGRATAFGYLSWPKGLRCHVQGKDVLDVGCGTGIHGVGFAVVGVRSYVGVDPRLRLDMGRAKNMRTRRWEPFGWTPAQIMAALPQVRLLPGSFEQMSAGDLPTGDGRFDVAVLHTTTEHLLRLDEVLAGIRDRLRPDGRLIYSHHNFYCWNGHHMPPKAVDEIDPDDPEQRQFVDWAHLEFDPPAGHYIARGLNRIRLDELRSATERHYEIMVWNELPSDAARGANRLTPAIRARYARYSERELRTQHVFCVARPRP